MKDSILYVWLQLCMGICSRISGEILCKFNSITEIYNCRDFSFLGDKRQKYITRLENKDTSEAFEILKRCNNIGAEVIGYYDELYPKSLRKIPSPPVALYYIGNLKNLNNIPCVAVVGTRKMSDYGKDIAENFAYTFCKSGACVISGLAKGVDTAAHRGAIMAGGYTIGVLGNPIGDVYPKENVKAFQTLYERGLVISEMYPGCPRTKADFPNRNRIISGMSDAIVIAEAGEGSGALITARFGLEQGKKVFAVPGAIGAENAGTNTLIKTGIPAATEPQDIIAALTLDYPEVMRTYKPAVASNLFSYGNGGGSEKAVEDKKQNETAPVREPVSVFKDNPVDEDDVSRRILAAMDGLKPITADELTAITGIPVSEIMAELTILEIMGDITAYPGGRYIKAKA